MKKIVTILLLIIFFPFWGISQNDKKDDYSTLLVQLEDEASKGNLIALRDLGGLMNKKATSKEAENIIRNYTFFLDEEWKWNERKETFLQFFYNNKSRIRFFHPAQIFYIAAFNIDEVDYKIEPIPASLKTGNAVLLRKKINAFEKALISNDEKRTGKALKSIINIPTKESQHYLLQVLQKRLIHKSRLKNKTYFLLLISKALQHLPSLETLQEILLNVEQENIPLKESKSILANLTNHHLAEIEKPNDLVNYFFELVDSLETMENIRYAGYENIFDFDRYIFPHEVDYFGRIVDLANDYPWMKRNAIYDLMSTEHERAYLYLASDFYKNHLARNTSTKKQTISLDEYRTLFQSSNQLVIKVLDKNKEYQNIFDSMEKKKLNDDLLKRNFLMYWISHHNDFEWSQGYELYINKFEILAKTENLEKLFRRLNSSNDDVAMESFQQITEGSPTEVLNLANKYRQLLRNPNNTLPNLRHQYIEQLALLTDYCRNNTITYLPNKKLKQKLDRLRGDISPKLRFEYEDRLINSLDISEVTAVEYYTCLNEGNADFVYSIGRVLDYFYSENWEAILQNDNQLRLYLKKTELFKRIGTIGSANYYLNKLESPSKMLTSRFRELLEVEPDDDIIFLLENILPAEEVAEDSDLDEFIDNPLDFSKNDIRVLPAPSLEATQAIINKMKEADDIKMLKKYLSYLRKNPSIDAVPIYFQLIDNEFVISKKYDSPITLADLTVQLIELAYDHHYKPEDNRKRFATEKWKNLWEADGENYKNWVNLFFEQKLKQLEYADKLKIDVINNVFASEYYQPKYKTKCLTALKNVRPLKHIKKLKTPEKLSVKTDLKYFEDFFFSYKDLDDIPKLFEVDDSEILFDYLFKRTEDFDISELGTFWNSVFRQSWFLKYINSNDGTRKDDFEKIKIALNDYLNESDLISEYEEQTTTLNISQLESSGKKLTSRLLESIQSEKDEATKALIQQSIIARASYDEVGIIITMIHELSTSQNFQPLLFLQRDFGLPIYNLEDEEVRMEVIEHHSKMKELDFYKYYLKSFGVDFLSKKNRLDFQKIYDLLQYEIVSPFVGGGGGHRDQFTYGLIKVLELHFKTRLGFNEKLNENQTFYSYTSTKRAKAWRSYLIDNQLVKIKENAPSSFNDVVNK